MEPLKTVNLYIETDLHGPRRADGIAMYILETQTSKGAATRDKLIPIPSTTEHHLALEAMEDALGRINQSCQVEIYLQDQYIAAAIDGGLVQQWQIRDWQTAKGKPVTDADLWAAIAGHLRKHIVTLHPTEHHGYCTWMQDQIKRYKKDRLSPAGAGK